MTPSVSIIINNFNYGRFLREAIDSALRQTHDKVEVLVVDDGSTDDSRDIIRSYADAVVPVLKENGGQASAFNAGFAVARGDVVAFLDADDVFLPTKAEVLAKAWRTYERAAFLYHPVQPVDETGSPFGKQIPSRAPSGDLGSLLRRSGGWLPFPPTSGTAFCRRSLAHLFPIPEKELRLCADSYLCDGAVFLGSSIYLPDVLANYRIHGGNRFFSADYRNGEALLRSLELNRIRNRMINAFLAAEHAEPVDLGKNFGVQRAEWLLDKAVPTAVPRLIGQALTYPAFTVAERVRAAAKVLVDCAQRSVEVRR